MATNGVYKKYISPKSHKVAVVISKGYGAGWASWATGRNREIAAFDHKVVMAVLKGNIAEAVRIAEAKMPDRSHWRHQGTGNDMLEVVWVDQGKEFMIHEYDGDDIVMLKEEMEFLSS